MTGRYDGQIQKVQQKNKLMEEMHGEKNAAEYILEKRDDLLYQVGPRGKCPAVMQSVVIILVVIPQSSALQ